MAIGLILLFFIILFLWGKMSYKVGFNEGFEEGRTSYYDCGYEEERKCS